MAPDFLNNILTGVGDMAINAAPEIGAVVGDIVAPGVGGVVGEMAGSAIQSIVTSPESGDNATESDPSLMGVPEVPQVQRGIAAFAGETSVQESTAAIVPVSQQTESIESLRRFFARPQFIDTMPLSYTSSWIIPSEYFLRPPVQEKLKSYSGIRYTLCIRITTNAPPTSNGAYCVSFMPYDTYTMCRANSQYANNGSHNLSQLPQLLAMFHAPHIIHDISQTSSSEFRIPFYQPFRFVDTGSLLGVASASHLIADDMLGRIDICNISKVFGNGYQVVSGDLAVWMWLEDVELFYPTDFDSVHGRKAAGPTITERLTSQIAQGPVHHSNKPNFSLVAQTRDDIDDVAHPPGIAKPMALTNTVTETEGNFSDSILDYFKIPSLLGHIDITSATSHGRIHVRPYTSCNLSRDFPTFPPTTAYPPTKLAVSTDLFQFWRGSINYRFSFITSKFHSCRVQFGFVPHVALGTAVQSDDLWSNISTVILDLREQHEIAISCPFRLALNHAYRNDVSGTLLWRVISPLVAPDGCSRHITAFVETWAGDDFTVARYNPAQGGLSWFAGLGSKSDKNYFLSEYEGSNCFEAFPDLMHDCPQMAQGPLPDAPKLIGDSINEIIKDTVNDGVPPLSHLFSAVTPMTQVFTEGVQNIAIGADNDVLVGGWTVPRMGCAEDSIDIWPDLSPLQKLRQLFYGVKHDAYVSDSTLGVRYGEDDKAMKTVFPFTSNAQYYGPAMVALHGGTLFGNTSELKGSFINTKVFYPWVMPVIAGVSNPRAPSKDGNPRDNPLAASKGFFPG